MDSKEKVRGWINYQLAKLRRIANLGSLFLLVFTNSILIAGYLEQRDVHPYVAIPLVFFSFSLLIWYVSHLYVAKFEMYRTEKLAEKILDPYAVYGMLPYEEMWFREIYIPQQECFIELLPKGKQKEKMVEHLNRIKVWVEKGIIPKSHFPEHLKKYYLTDKEHRLEM